jgi:hypothetical protein
MRIGNYPVNAFMDFVRFRLLAAHWLKTDTDSGTDSLALLTVPR